MKRLRASVGNLDSPESYLVDDPETSLVRLRLSGRYKGDYLIRENEGSGEIISQAYQILKIKKRENECDVIPVRNAGIISLLRRRYSNILQEGF